MRTITKPSLLSLSFYTLLIGVASAVVIVSVTPPPNRWSAPDNDVGQPSQTSDITSNTGTKDVVLTITVTGEPKDEVFSVEIVDTKTGDVLDTVEFSEGNAPPVTMPPGSTARARDDADSNSQKPGGTWKTS